ncbi:histidine phosphatase family protein [Sulfitobacter sp. S190]|uniref:histidine phosphatase family protein n=1 Tax=Sulfitobacter sp. S190 TaxID=2867022 RepID=UPI0021A2CB6E|nr:histidine phosphatase family protein [Sulfitobacter sp. S190]UWR20959.1 histidine phosphatase family protein [Sulfitobacter sp. S190]
MSQYPPVYILRHGETSWNAQGRLQGRYDSPLTVRGRAQARLQNDILSGLELSDYEAYSSPQGRAFHTASLALNGVVDTIHTDTALSEIGVGDWAGELRDPLIKRYAVRDGFDLYERAPGGEGFAALEARCRRFLQGLEHPAVLVTHGLTSRMLRIVLQNKNVDALRVVGGGQGVVFHVENGKQKRLTKSA